MSDDNSRKEAMRHLKLSSATVVDSFQRGLSESDTCNRSNVFLQEYFKQMSSRAHQNTVEKFPFPQGTQLVAANFLSKPNSGSCSCQGIDDVEVALFANELENEKPISIGSTQESLDEINKGLHAKSQVTLEELFSQQYEPESPCKKLKPTVERPVPPRPLNPWKAERAAQNSRQLVTPKSRELSHPFKQNYVPSKPLERQKPVLANAKNLVQSTLRPSFNMPIGKEEQQKVTIKQQPVTVNESSTVKNPFADFKTGRQELEWQKALQNNSRFPGLPKQMGSSKNAFPPPPQFNPPNSNDHMNAMLKKFKIPLIKHNEPTASSTSNEEEPLLKGFDKAILERIEREIVSSPSEVTWDDIVGLDNAKQVINESITIAMNHPEFFTGLRAAPKAILFFGPPGTGKTLIGKCIASSCSATFLSISASSLTSKWIGESEALVRAMFSYARLKQPSVIFFDEIDSLLEKRGSETGGGNEVYNRIKTEFLVQLDGVSAISTSDRVLFIAATNLPYKIDEAILRRFAKRIYVPLPVPVARVTLFKNLLANERHRLSEEQFEKLGELSDGYSGSDINQVCKEAAMKPLRKIANVLSTLSVDEIPPISYKHFVKAFRSIKSSVSAETIKVLEDWNTKYGFSANLSNSDDDSDSEDDDY